GAACAVLKHPRGGGPAGPPPPGPPASPPPPAPAARPSPPPAAAPTPPPARPPAPVPTPAEDQAVPLSRMRKLIAENVTRSKTTIPHAWQTQEVDMSGVAANRNSNKPAFQQREGFSLTYLPYMTAASIASLR